MVPGVRLTMPLACRVALGSLWAGLLVLVGLWLLTEWAARLESARGVCVLAGVTAVAMGQFVFAALVADRLFPGASIWARGAVQGLSGAVYVAGGLLLVMVLIGG